MRCLDRETSGSGSITLAHYAIIPQTAQPQQRQQRRKAFSSVLLEVAMAECVAGEY